jgi:hypothetical protein
MSVSRSVRTEIVVCVAALAGCMKIYPDPELPDIDVEWYDGDCGSDSDTVLLTLVGVDDPSQQQQVSAPCSGLKTTFEDVARQRYKLDGSLRDAMGEETTRAATLDLDLRNGLDETAYLFFGRFDNISVAWQFDGGGTCASVGAELVEIGFRQDDTLFPVAAPCPAMVWLGNVPDGTYRVEVTARDNDGGAVATAPPLDDVAIGLGPLTNVGVTLTPCGGSCP